MYRGLDNPYQKKYCKNCNFSQTKPILCTTHSEQQWTAGSRGRTWTRESLRQDHPHTPSRTQPSQTHEDRERGKRRRGRGGKQSPTIHTQDPSRRGPEPTPITPEWPSSRSTGPRHPHSCPPSPPGSSPP